MRIHIYFFFITVNIIIGCSTFSQNHSNQYTLEVNKNVIRRSHEEIWSKGNFDIIQDIYTTDFVCHFVIGPEWIGQEGLYSEVSSHRKSFPDWNEEIQMLVAEGNYVVSYFKSSGTHLGVFHELMPTNRKIQIDEIAIYRLENGKIAEQWGYPDVNGMNIQLGITEP